MPSPTDVASLLYLWTERTLYIGTMSGLESFTPAASSLVLGLEKPLRIRDAGSTDFIEARSLLIPAGVPVELESSNHLIASCYLDPLGRDLAAFKTCMQHQAGRLWYGSVQEARQLTELEALYRARLPAAQAYRVLLDAIFPPAQVRAAIPPARADIAAVVDRIRRDPVSNPSNQELARDVGMSEAQLQRQFKWVTGIPVRRYRLWHRLFVTATWMMLGKTLTEAALAAGFSDSSHFNHAFRSMLGLKPSFVLKRRDRIFIFAGGDNDSGDGGYEQPRS